MWLVILFTNPSLVFDRYAVTMLNLFPLLPISIINIYIIIIHIIILFK